MTTEDEIVELSQSPCIGVCEIDPVSSYCRGCGRDIHEISAWRTLNPQQRREIMVQLPARLPLTRRRRGGRNKRQRNREMAQA